ncbi:MAG: nuclease-related domain-containing protein [Sideroxydans sp.]|nr:nuclease-related domain-containing protein [Sideroxydans sp.]
MIIKEADDAGPKISALQALVLRPDITSETRRRIEQEIRNIQAGVHGEEEAAYEMKVHYGESHNWALIHDLRIEHEGLVAQIDHLVINRWLDMWVCESKHFSEGVGINEHGEFVAFFNGKPYGVPSPIEQNAKHILILQRLFDSGAVELPKRLGFTIKPELKGLVLVSKKARISRPKSTVEGIECVIKNDQFFKTVDKAVDENGLLSMGKIVGSDTLEDIAWRIAALHRPASFDWAAKFGLSAAVAALAPKPAAPVQKEARPKFATEPELAQEVVQPLADGKPKSKLVCHACGEQVAYNVAKFCWFNKAKFGGNIFCMDCQKQV